MLACVRQLKDEFEASLIPMLTEEDDEASNSIAEEMAEKITNEFHDQARENLSLVRCAVHTLQLAILDVVDKSHPNVKQVTEVAKRCKNVKYKTNFDYHNATYPPVWCQTRWELRLFVCGGIFKMLDSFLEQKSFFVQLGQEFPELYLSSNWEFVEQYAEAFRPLFVCTKKFQEAHMSLNDFYLEWLMTIREVRQLENNPFSKVLVESLTRRLTNLKGSMAFKMALYLDPRLSFINSKIFTIAEKEHIQVTINKTVQFIPGTSEFINFFFPKYTEIYFSNMGTHQT
ncbi:uncharacterized protein LOC135702608, partial [Ochlerotatus camptorhynchus]|uniref:uncharacterized protein LOC135702608 n=1 Tax=Ochlerotatus camptorhynchus TaxID=644619 RepID=UPI0031E0F7BA